VDAHGFTLIVVLLIYFIDMYYAYVIADVQWL